MRQDRFQDRLHLPRHRRQRGTQPDDLLFRPVALNLSLERNLQPERLDRFRIVFLLHGLGEDGLQGCDGGLGEALRQGVIDPLPRIVPRRSRQRQDRNERREHTKEKTGFHRDGIRGAGNWQ